MISADDLKTDAEKIADAARMARLIKRARRVRIYFNVIGGAFGAYFIFGYLGNTQPWVWEYAVGLLAFVFLSAMVVGYIAEKTFARIEGLGQPATFREQYFPDTPRPPADTPAASAVTASVPRLDLLRGAAEAQVLTAALMEGPSVFVTAAGRAGTAPGRLPVGVGMFTRNGFAFLPDAEPDSARALQELGGAAWEVAKDLVKGLGVLEALGVGEARSEEQPLPAWAAKSAAHPDHFAIPWPELVEAAYNPSSRTATVTRERDDGSRVSYLVGTEAPSLPVALMQARMAHELLEVGRARIMRPKAEELLPDLLAKFRVVYGDRINEHGEEILAELNKRVTEWMSEAKPDLEGVCRAAMAPVLPHYARIPQIVANQPWLFVVPAADGAAAGV